MLPEAKAALDSKCWITAEDLSPIGDKLS
jgi:hypothetical protein